MADTTHHEQGSRRDRSIRQTFLASSGLQAVALVVTLTSLPFVTRALGTEAYGVLATLTGFVALLGFADLGIGAAVTTRLAMALGRDDAAEASRVVSTGLVAITAASTMLLVVGSLLTWLLPWNRVLGVESLPAHDVRKAVFCAVVAVSLSVLGSLGQRVLYGMQKGGIANLWLLAATLIGAGLSITAALVGAPLYVFVLAGIGSAAVVGVVCTWWVLVKSAGRFPVSHEAMRVDEFRALATSSGWFLAISVSSILAFQTDTLIVATLLGAADAGVFSIVTRLFGLVLAVLFPALLQMWPAIGEAFTRGDIAWIRSRIRWAIVLEFCLATAACTAIALLGRSGIGWLFGPGLKPPQGLLSLMAVFTTLSLTSAPLAIFLNAVGRVRTHAYLAIAVGVTNLPLSWVLTGHVGIVGPVIGSLVTNVCLASIPAAFIVRRILRRASAVA